MIRLFYMFAGLNPDFSLIIRLSLYVPLQSLTFLPTGFDSLCRRSKAVTT
ncbi:hypothetical protein [Porphyromonas loveana]